MKLIAIIRLRPSRSEKNPATNRPQPFVRLNPVSKKTAWERCNPRARPNPVASTSMLAPAAPANTQVSHINQNSRVFKASATERLAGSTAVPVAVAAGSTAGNRIRAAATTPMMSAPQPSTRLVVS